PSNLNACARAPAMERSRGAIQIARLTISVPDRPAEILRDHLSKIPPSAWQPGALFPGLDRHNQEYGFSGICTVFIPSRDVHYCRGLQCVRAGRYPIQCGEYSRFQLAHCSIAEAEHPDIRAQRLSARAARDCLGDDEKE